MIELIKLCIGIGLLSRLGIRVVDNNLENFLVVFRGTAWRKITGIADKRVTVGRDIIFYFLTG